VDACNPLLQAHPTWARDEHEGRGIPTSLTPVSGRLAPFPPSRSPTRSTHLGWARGDTHSSARGTPRSRNADKSLGFSLFYFIKYTKSIHILVNSIGTLKLGYLLLLYKDAVPTRLSLSCVVKVLCVRPSHDSPQPRATTLGPQQRLTLPHGCNTPGVYLLLNYAYGLKHGISAIITVSRF
jgi:hypothetical protein